MENPEIGSLGINYNYFAFSESLHDLDISAGDDIFIVGYPATYKEGQSELHPLFQDTSIHPIVESRIIASRIGQPYIHNGKEINGFLVDGLTIKGINGSPVFTKEPRYMVPKNSESSLDAIAKSGISPLLFLGIVAETELTLIPGSEHLTTYAGFDFAFSADIVKETREFLMFSFVFL